MHLTVLGVPLGEVAREQATKRRICLGLPAQPAQISVVFFFSFFFPALADSEFQVRPLLAEVITTQSSLQMK